MRAASMHIHPLITDSDSLLKLCERLAKSSFVAVDTEFMRENTYWPDLCLVQIGNLEEAAAIDPKADGLDLTPSSTCSSTTRTCSRSSTPAGRISRSSST